MKRYDNKRRPYYRLLCGNLDLWAILVREHQGVELYLRANRHGLPWEDPQAPGPERNCLILALAQRRTRLPAVLTTRGVLEVL